MQNGRPLFRRSFARLTAPGFSTWTDIATSILSRDTGAMPAIHPQLPVSAVQEQVARGITLMLPSEELCVGENCRSASVCLIAVRAQRHGCNRFSIRLAVQITGRGKILSSTGVSR